MSKLRGSGVCDARCQQFYREVAKKEEIIKNQWFIKNRQRLYDNLQEQKVSPKLKSFLHKQKDDKKRQAEIVQEQPFLPWRLSEDAKFDWMRPIKPDTKDILYIPKTESFYSKQRYLNERYAEKPEDRYYFPYCSSWIYGWRLKDYPPYTVSKFGRRSIIKSSFYCRNASSLQRDPDWYSMCQTGDPKNFNELLNY